MSVMAEDRSYGAYHDAHLATVLCDLSIHDMHLKVQALQRELGVAQASLAIMILQQTDLRAAEDVARHQ